MNKRQLRAPSPALVISSLALFVALGGTTYAAINLPANSVGSKALKSGAVTPPKVAQATIALFQGQTGPPGPPGSPGSPGPGGTIAAYDASASASPTVTTVGTFLGDTLKASCSIPAAGEAQLNLFLTTSTGAWSADLAELDEPNGSPSPLYIKKVNVTGGGAVNLQIGLLEANAGGHESDEHQQFIQLAPTSGSLTIHQTTSTMGGTQTCHLAVQSFPETMTSITG